MHACYKLPESNNAHGTFWLRDYVTFGKAYVQGYVVESKTQLHHGNLANPYLYFGNGMESKGMTCVKQKQKMRVLGDNGVFLPVTKINLDPHNTPRKTRKLAWHLKIYRPSLKGKWSFSYHFSIHIQTSKHFDKHDF